jgi:hypothetical protein
MSNPNILEPNDLAIVIKSLTGKSLGKIVTCIAKNPMGPDPKFGDVWLVQSSHKNLTIFVDGTVSDQAHMPQDWLKKIPKDPLPDEEDLYALDDSKTLEKVE